MSDSQRRLLCRLGLVAFCALPTFIVVNWVLFPRSTAQWQAHARQLVNCPVEIGRVETPTPNQLVFRNIRIGDAESQTWTEFETVDWIQSLNSQHLELSDLDLNVSQFNNLLRLLWERAPQIQLGTRQIEMHLGQITIRSDPENAAAGGIFVCKDCWIRIDPGTVQPRLTVEFFTEQKSDNPVRWEAIFSSKSLPTSWSLNTNGSAIPCWLVSHAWPAALRLGDRSWFGGFLSGELSTTQSTIDVSSLQLLEVDPDKMLGATDSTSADKQSCSIKLAPETICAILVASARIVDGRLEAIDCRVQCLQPGQIANRLLQAAKKWLRVDVPNASSDEFVEFSQLAFRLEIRGGMLSIHGQEPDGRIAVSGDQQPLIFATPASVGLAPHCLAGWIADEGQIQLPVSAASLEIMSHLPMFK